MTQRNGERWSLCMLQTSQQVLASLFALNASEVSSLIGQLSATDRETAHRALNNQRTSHGG
jgi:hypothetical protein